MNEPATRTVLDPTDETRPTRRERTERPPSLEGAVVGLLDISKPLGDAYLERVEELLAERGITTRRYRKPTFAKPAPVDLRHEISQHCHVVIEALAD